MSNLSEQITTNINQHSTKSFIKKLIDGDFSLVKTYWLYGVVGSIIMNLLMIFPIISGSMPLLVSAVLISIAYAIIVLSGIWNSAGKYTGSMLWSVLAKIIVILNGTYLFASITMMFSA